MYKNRLILFLLITCSHFFAQPTESPYRKEKPVKCYEYIDKYKNDIFMCGVKKYPRGVDTTFIKENITGLHFVANLLDREKRFTFFIRQIRYIKKKKKYKIMLMIYRYPIAAGNIDKDGSYGHKRYYIMTLKQNENKILIVDSVVFEHQE